MSSIFICTELPIFQNHISPALFWGGIFSYIIICVVKFSTVWKMGRKRCPNIGSFVDFFVFRTSCFLWRLSSAAVICLRLRSLCRILLFGWASSVEPLSWALCCIILCPKKNEKRKRCPYIIIFVIATMPLSIQGHGLRDSSCWRMKKLHKVFTCHFD